MFYYEQTSHDGAWQPVTAAAEPEVKDGRIRLSGSVGPRVRAVQEINPGHRHLSLDALASVYSPDGKFRGTTR